MTAASPPERPPSGWAYPADAPHAGRPWQGYGTRGRRYGPSPAELDARLESWITTGRVEGFPALKPPNVFRCGGLVVKLFPPGSLVRRILRRPPAIREAEEHFRLLPVRSPRPLLATGRLPGGPSAPGGLLISEFVEGELLRDVWRTGGAPVEALPGLLALMHRHGVWHADLHPKNLLWDGAHWFLLDLSAVRSRLHSGKRVATGQWARLLMFLGDEERVRDAFRRYEELIEPGTGLGLDWQDVRARAARILRGRGRPLPEDAPARADAES